MTLPVEPPRIPIVPDRYDPMFFHEFKRELDIFVRRLNTIGLIQATQVRITDLPTSSAGLSAGTLWNDSGTVKVV